MRVAARPASQLGRTQGSSVHSVARDQGKALPLRQDSRASKALMLQQSVPYGAWASNQKEVSAKSS